MLVLVPVWAARRCEWRVVAQMAEMDPSPLAEVTLLLIELHPGLLLNTDADLALFATFFEYIFVRLGFRIWYQHPNTGGRDKRKQLRRFHPVLAGALGLDTRYCCYELGLMADCTVKGTL